ncbi:MAG: TIGR00282 family metallophosphoesterase [Armatimonadetes bacterium]|nr:TIGR00282 family metallophosphoesterase [Armatimonadota bacterium]
MRILFVGDIVGRPGKQAAAQLLPGLREEFAPDFVIANGENAAGGMGITKDTGAEIFKAGIDAVTLGNHVWAKKECYSYLDDEPRIVRPANYPSGVPGRGWAVFATEQGESIGVVNVCGRIFMDHLDNPFTVTDRIIETLAPDTDVILVDFHAEATSEKVAFGWYVSGRVAAVIGTHTHVQTADERILPGGTAYITDVGMTGPVDSVIGVKKDLIISRFLTQMPNKFEIAEGDTMLSAAVIDVDSEIGKATRIERIQRSISRK